MTCGRKIYRYGILHARAVCRDCEYDYVGANALGLAALHHDRTGHTINIEIATGVTYGTPEALAQIEEGLGRSRTQQPWHSTGPRGASDNAFLSSG